MFITKNLVNEYMRLDQYFSRLLTVVENLVKDSGDMESKLWKTMKILAAFVLHTPGETPPQILLDLVNERKAMKHDNEDKHEPTPQDAE